MKCRVGAWLDRLAEGCVAVESGFRERTLGWGLMSSLRLGLIGSMFLLFFYAVSGSLGAAALSALPIVLLLLFGVAFPAPVRARRVTRGQFWEASRGLSEGRCAADTAVAREVLRLLDRRRERYDKQRSGGVLRLIALLGPLCMVYFVVRDVHYHRPGPAAAAFVVLGFELMATAMTPRWWEKSIQRAEAAGLAASDVLAGST